ncbi:MAG: hypothetical protein J0H54_11750, partial [Rhizobiales bacterium]|nr:hypothetical protein [Hyphomicrobiales bacterium]
MPHDRGLASIALAIARQDARRPRLAEEAASAEQLQATRAAAEAERAVFRAEREAIRTGQAADVPRHERARRERELYIRERNHEAAERAEQLKLRRRALDRVLVDGLHAL